MYESLSCDVDSEEEGGEEDVMDIVAEDCELGEDEGEV
jgi:hypothetical protein